METNTIEKIRIRLESFNHELLVNSCQKISNVLQNVELFRYQQINVCIVFYVLHMLTKIRENILKYAFIKEC